MRLKLYQKTVKFVKFEFVHKTKNNSYGEV